jgi:hypothetical protein
MHKDIILVDRGWGLQLSTRAAVMLGKTDRVR